jgi:membrane-bound lytic murein transglycosylase D
MRSRIPLSSLWSDAVLSALALSLAMAALPACRTARPKSPTPRAPIAPSVATPTPQPASTEQVLSARPAASPLPGAAAPSPSPTPTAAAEALEAESEAAAAEEDLANGPQAAQKEALDLCQEARAMLDRNEREAAVATLDRAYELMLTLPANGDDAYLQAKDDIRLVVADLIRRAYKVTAATTKTPTPSWDLALPIVDNAHVQREIQSFRTVERDLFLEAYRRSGLYRPMILAKLEAAGLPSQLSWLPMVESWFKVRALSRAGALGLWQFIASTGQRYGLGRDGWVEDRMAPDKATDGAIAYLTELHAMFGDWPKALAAYNCGEARVLRLQNHTRDQYLDFWDLYEQLPIETRRYVPRFIAALLIIENPAKYGMELPQPLKPAEDVALTRIERAVDLARLNEVLGLPEGTLKDLNPELRFGATPSAPHDLRVPVGVRDAVTQAAAQLPEWKRPTPAYLVHRVRSGETLGLIARHYGTTVGAIQRASGLRSTRYLRVGQRLRIPIRDRGRR